MATYKVTSEIVSGKSLGDTITDDELEGSSVEALIIAGHIAPTTKTTKKDEAE
ncbi:hypothetical protein UFOVP1054_16 [uncultured Caudovirales phage]|uniref:Uncharacterized protein n=1 Tax=uncultured Caudovirales phage TaxID=2100421 RepID=A0A6J5QBZ5_9CAUD|nr:hypothetical protein UFOVP1054_16 [uncultured Caudovirales phage]